MTYLRNYLLTVERRIANRPADLSRAYALLGLLACSGAAAWMTAALWEPGLPAGLDMARHYWRARVESELFFANGHVDGWSPYWHLGLQQFLFQSYGYYFAMALAHRLVGDGVAFLTVFKAFLVVPFLVLPWMAYAMARAVHIARWACLVGAATVLSVASGTGFGIKGWYSTGLMLQAPGVLLIGVAILTAIRGINKGGIWVPMTALATGIALVTHLISGAYILSAVTIYAAAVAVRDRDFRPLFRGLVIVAIALGLATHCLARSLELTDLMGAPVGWGETGPLHHILRATFFASPVVSIIAYCGTLAGLVSRRRGLFALAVLFVGTALFASGPHFALPTKGLTDLADTVFRPRSIPVACLLFPIMVAYGCETISIAASRGSLPVVRRIPYVFTIALAATVVALGAGRAIELSSIPRTVGMASPELTAPYDRVIEHLRDNAKKPAVVGFEMDVFERKESGSPRFASLLNNETGLFALGGDQSEATDARHHRSVEPNRFAKSEPTRMLRYLRTRSVGWLALRAPRAISRARAMPGLELALSAGTVELFRVQGRHRFLSGPGLDVLSVHHAPERITWNVRNRRESTQQALLAVSRHPNWRAWIDTTATGLKTTADRLLTTDIPPGTHTLEIRWIRPLRERFYNLVSIMALATIALMTTLMSTLTLATARSDRR
ncbi:MAG: hypothetical protein ACI8TX_002490 [Hyphomicrobiaceae bacterium]|jgi:hypothetical protein